MIGVRSWKVQLSYQMIAKPGNKTAAPSWSDPYVEYNMILHNIAQQRWLCYHLIKPGNKTSATSRPDPCVEYNMILLNTTQQQWRQNGSEFELTKDTSCLSLINPLKTSHISPSLVSCGMYVVSISKNTDCYNEPTELHIISLAAKIYISSGQPGIYISHIYLLPSP